MRAVPTPKEETLAALFDAAIVGIVRSNDATKARTIAHAMLDGGLRAIEVTTNTPGCFELIAELAHRTPGLVGVGTVTSAEHVVAGIEAGARFLVSPHGDPDLIAAARDAKCVCIPGALTPTEILKAHRAGADVVKIFPVGSVGGASYLRAIAGPLPNIPLWVSGGIGLEQAPELLRAGAKLVGLSTVLIGEHAADAASMRDRTARALAFITARRTAIAVLEIAGPQKQLKLSAEDLGAKSGDLRSLDELVPGRQGTAVALAPWLTLAGIPRDATVELRAVDGSFTRRIDAAALFDGGWLCFALNGAPLSQEAGGPVRLYIVGGGNACDNVKGLAEIRGLE